MNKTLQLRLEDAEDFIGHVWVVHDPETTDDAVLRYDDGREVEAGNYLTAERVARQQYPGYAIERV